MADPRDEQLQTAEEAILPAPLSGAPVPPMDTPAPPPMPTGPAPMRDFGATPRPDVSGLGPMAGGPPQQPQAAPTVAGPSPERFRNTLKSFGHAKDDLMARKLALDPGDPTYLQKLANLHGAEGDIRREEADYKERHPWGTMESAHPGFFGKLGHAFGAIGNVAGAALAPGLTEAIPGSRLNLEAQKAAGQAEIGEAAKETSEAAAAGLKGAQTQVAQAEVPLKQAQTEKTGAETAKTEAQTNVIEQVGGKKFEKLSDNSIVEVTPNPDGSSSAKMIYKGDPKMKTAFRRGELVNGKPHDLLVDANTGQTIHDLGEVAQPAGADKGVTMIVPSQTAPGTGEAVRVAPGTKGIPLGAQTPSGFAEQGRPTSQMRNTGQRAEQAVAGIPGVLTEIDNLKDTIGPVAGRWNDFMQGKIGAADPLFGGRGQDFAGLRADLLMLSSAVALAHAQGRLPENLREEFDKMINAPKQDPENMKAVLNHILPWMQRAAATGEGPFQAPGAAPATSGGGFAAWKQAQGGAKK